MKKLTLYLIAVSLSWTASTAAQDEAFVTLFYSPHGGCDQAICKAIDNSESEILVAAYSFSSKPIANSLYAASKRGVKTFLILDRSQPTAHYSMCDELSNRGLTVRIDRKEPLMHQKIIIIDRKLLICGSYNFTASAENRNAEILVFIQGKATASKAAVNWLHHFEHSIPYLTTRNRTCVKGYCPIVPSKKLPSNPYRRF